MALLNNSTLYGAGNKNISDQQIRDFIGKAGTNEAVLAGALKNGVSTNQIANAMQGQQGWDQGSINKWLGNVTPTSTTATQASPPPERITAKPVTYKPADFVKANIDPTTGTVAGQLDKNINNLNSALNVSAANYGEQAANRRGLLNSSIGASSAYKNIVDAGLQIATPDAAAYNQYNLQNADAENRTNQFNTEQRTANDQFNSNLGAEVAKFNTQTSEARRNTDLGFQNSLDQLNLQQKNNLAQIDAKLNADLKLAQQSKNQEAVNNINSQIDKMNAQMANIMAADMTGEQKGLAMNNLMKGYNLAVNANKLTSDLDFSDLVIDEQGRANAISGGYLPASNVQAGQAGGYPGYPQGFSSGSASEPGLLATGKNDTVGIDRTVTNEQRALLASKGYAPGYLDFNHENFILGSDYMVQDPSAVPPEIFMRPDVNYNPNEPMQNATGETVSPKQVQMALHTGINPKAMATYNDLLMLSASGVQSIGTGSRNIANDNKYVIKVYDRDKMGEQGTPLFDVITAQGRDKIMKEKAKVQELQSLPATPLKNIIQSPKYEVSQYSATPGVDQGINSNSNNQELRTNKLGQPINMGSLLPVFRAYNLDPGRLLDQRSTIKIDQTGQIPPNIKKMDIANKHFYYIMN